MKNILKAFYLMLPLTARVWIAGRPSLNNPFGRQFDVHGRPYWYAYSKFGHQAMLEEAKSGNTWKIFK